MLKIFTFMRETTCDGIDLLLKSVSSLFPTLEMDKSRKRARNEYCAELIGKGHDLNCCSDASTTRQRTRSVCVAKGKKAS